MRAGYDHFLLLLGLALPTAVQAADARLFSLDDVNREREVSEPRISPDGRWVAYTVTVTDEDKDTTQSDIWMADWEGRNEIQITDTPGDESQPLWSPDGRWLSFISDRGGKDAKSQIWLLDRRGGEARALTKMPESVSDYAWSPDSKRLVLVSEAGGDAPAKDEDKPKPVVIDRFQFKQDETGYLTPAHSHLFLYTIDGGEAVQLTSGAFDHLMPVWSPDGSAIAYSSKRGDDPDRNHNWDVFLMAPAAGAAATQLTTNPGMDTAPEWGYGAPVSFSPDGRRIVYIHGGEPKLGWFAVLQLGVVGANGSKLELPTRDLDRNALAPRYTQRHIYFLLEDDMGMQLARLPAGGGAIERLTKHEGVVSEYDVGPRDRIAVVSATADRPGEVFALDGGRPRQLSHQNDKWMAELKLAETSAISYSSKDDTEIHALLLKPPGFEADRKYPVVVRLHGGPVAQYQYQFQTELQLYAANGYVVVGPNYRGSSGRGEAFQKAILGNWGDVEVQDVLGAVDYLVEQGIADPERLAVGGWSYGGMLTNYVIASDTRFAAAASGAGISNMLAGYGTDMYVRDWENELGLPWEQPDKWMKVSYPFLHADRIKTPTLFMGGALDLNVPVIHSEQMYQALKRLGVPTQLVVYPDQYHEINRPSFWKDRLRRYLEWFDRHAKQ